MNFKSGDRQKHRNTDTQTDGHISSDIVELLLSQLKKYSTLHQVHHQKEQGHYDNPDDEG